MRTCLSRWTPTSRTILGQTKGVICRCRTASKERRRSCTGQCHCLPLVDGIPASRIIRKPTFGSVALRTCSARCRNRRRKLMLSAYARYLRDFQRHAVQAAFPEANIVIDAALCAWLRRSHIPCAERDGLCQMENCASGRGAVAQMSRGENPRSKFTTVSTEKASTGCPPRDKIGYRHFDFDTECAGSSLPDGRCTLRSPTIDILRYGAGLSPRAGGRHGGVVCCPDVDTDYERISVLKL